MPGRRLLTLVAVVAGALALPAGAEAYEICVAPASGCAVEHTHDTIQAAINDANDFPEKDTIKLGAATYEGEFGFDSPVDVVGAGIDSTSISGAKNGAGDPVAATWQAYLQSGGSSIRNLTVNLGDLTEYGVVLNNSTAENIKVLGRKGRPKRNDKGVLMNIGASVLRNATVDLPFGDATNDDWAVFVAGGAANSLIEDVTLSGDNAIVTQAAGLEVRRASLTGHRTMVLLATGDVRLSDSLVKAQAGSTGIAVALRSESHGGNGTTFRIKNTTILGPVPAMDSEGLTATQTCGGGWAAMIADGVTITGFTRSTHQVGCVTPFTTSSCPHPPAPNSASIQMTNSHRDSGIFTLNGGCRGESNLKTGAPNFVSADDLRPKFPSPLIDQGNQDPDDGSKDFAGRTRVVDGDGVGGPRRDIGAFEYQRQAPTVSASVTPATGPVSQVFTFSSSGADADGETLTYIWDFSDGATPLGGTVDKSFKAPGDYSGTVQAQDPSGLTARATASVKVTGAPTPTPTPAPTPQPGDTTAPAVTVKGGTLRVNARRKAKVRITCPATETAPCRIAIAVSSAKKILLGGKRKKIASLGRGSGRVANGKTATVTITLSKKAYRYLKRKKRLPAKLAVTARDAAGNSAKASASATLRPAKKKKRR